MVLPLSEQPETLILLNGPPGSGKDTIANYVQKTFGFEHYRFKTPLWAMFQVVHRLSNDDLIKYTQTPEKDIPQSIFNGNTPRQELIKLGEGLKGIYGQDFFGNYLRDSFKGSFSNLGIVSDAGFDGEVLPLVQACKNVHLIRVVRDGHDFSTDSRGWISSDIVKNEHVIHNPGDSYANLFGKVQEILWGILK